MKKLLTILAAVMTTTVGLKAQFSFTAENATTTVQFVPCGQPDTLQINITAAGAQTSAQVGVKLPSNGVFASLVSGGTLLSSSTDSFTVDLGNMTSGQTITLRYRVRMNCVGASNPAFNAAYRATSTTHTSTFTGQSYASSVYAPVLQFLAVDIDTSGLQEGGIHTRKYTIANSSASAISYFDTVYFRGKYKTGEAFVDLKVGSTTVTPTQTGDSLLYAITGSMLDADGRLNGGQSILVEERVQVTNQCALNNATTDPVQAYYGCFATRGCTAPVQLNAVTQVGATLNQGVVATVTNRIAQCQGAAPDTMYFTVSNPATAGKARDITFNIESNFADYNYDSRQTLSFFLNGSLNATYNGVAYNLLKDTLQVLQKHEQLHAALRTGAPIWYAAVPNDAIYNIRFRLDSMNPGDTIRGYMLYTLLCDSAAMVDHVNYYWSVNSPGYGSWSLPGLKNLRSRNNCNGNLVFSHPGTQSNRAPVVGGAAGAYMSMNTIGSIVGTENYYPSVSGNARVVMGAFDIAELRMTTARSIVEARVILPLGLTPASLTPSNYRVRALLNNAVSYTAYMVSVVGNELRIRFKPTSNGSFGLGDRYLDIPLNLDCGVLSGPKTDSIQAKWFVRVDSTCTSGCGFLNFARTSNLPVALHCPGTLPNGGLQAVSYDHRRWNLGLADYDNNGIPDGTGKAHPDSVVLNEFTFGDTMYTIQKGRVVVTGSTPGGAFTHGYSVQRFILPAASQLASSQDNFQPQGAKLVIYSNATASTYTVNGFMPSRHRFGDTVYYIYHLSNDSLRGKGNVPGSFAWANGDSITLESYTRFRTNGSSNEDVYVINQENDIYMATNAITTTNTAAINSHLRYTDEIKAFETDIYRLFNFGGVYGSVSFTTANTCIANSSYDQGSSGYVTLRQQNRAIYPKEYRRFQRLLAAQVTIPRKGVVIDSIRLFVSNSAVAGGGLTVLRVPDSALTMRYDSGFARIDLAKMMVAMGRPQGFDEGYTLTYRMHFRRNGAVMEQDPNSFSASAANLKIGVEYDAEGTDWGDLVNPYSGQVGRHNWYTAGQGANITRFLNPNYDGSALGAVTKTISGKTTSFDVRLQNATGAQQMDVDSAWVYFFSPSGAIKLKGATNITTSTALPVANGKLVRLGSLPAGQTRDVRLDVEFADGCGTDSFRVFYSWNCPGVSSPVADSQLVNFAVQDTTTHTITKFDPILENTTTVSRTANIALCDTILVSTLINNAGGGIGYDVDFSFTAPNFGTGIEFVPGSFRLQYPASGGPVVSIPAPTAIGGGQYRWVDITQYIAALDTQGLAAFTDPVNNKMRVSFQTRFTCGFNSGLTLNTYSQASCGTAGTSSFTTPIRLKAENQAANQFYTCTTDADTVNTCGLASANTLRTVFTNLNASANPSGANDSIFVYLPAGVSFNSGVASSPRAPDRAVAQPDGRQRLSWRVNGVAKGASQTFTYGVTGNDTLSCNVIQIQNQSGAFVQDTCILDGSLCLTGVIKSDVNSNLTIQKPAINLTAATATSVYNATTPVNEIVTINYSVNNTGTASTSHQIRTYHDADASGTFTPGDVLVNTRTINTAIANGASYSGTFNLDLLSSQTCPLILVIEQGACQCSRSQSAINSIKLNNAGLDTGLCHSTSIVLGAGTGPSAYTYAWTPATGLSSTSSSSPTLTGANLTGVNIVTNYILSTTRNSVASCNNLDTAIITQKPLPTITDIKDTAICNGNSVTITTSGGGTYAWNTLPVQTTASITVSPVANTQYIVTVTGTSGCKKSDTAVVTIKAAPMANAGGAKTRINCIGDSVQLGSATVAGVTYAWSPATNLSSTSVAQPWAKPTATTTYRLTVTNTSTLCTAVDSATVTVTTSTLMADAGADKAACLNAAAVSIGGAPTATGGTLPYAYAWTPNTGLSNSTIANPTKATTTAGSTNHIVMITDGKGCVARDTMTVTINPLPSVAPSATPSTICNGASTTIAANATGGTGTLSYSWNAGTGASHTQTPTSNTTYNVTVTDANLCTATGSTTVTVTGTSPLLANAGNARSICNGASTTLGGSPTASGGSGSFTYAWSGGAGTTANPVVSPTATTTYTVTVTSSTCTATSSVVVTVNPKPSVAPSATPSTICNGASTTIAANATGGTGTLSYSWNAGTGASHTQTPSSNTTYNVTVTDANLCTATGSTTVTVTGTSPLLANAGNARSICNGASTTLGGSPTASGGAGSFTYAWSGGAGTTANPVVSPTATTTYTVTVTSSTCTATSSVVVTVNPTPSVAPSASATSICYGASTTISANATGGTGTLNYTWSPTGSGASFTATPTSNTTYSVTVSDANTCTATGNVSVTVIGSSPLAANAGAARSICNGASTTLGGSPTASGGAGGFTYAWSGGAGTTANPVVSPTATTTYTVTVTSSTCTATSSVVVTVNPKPSVAPSASSTTVCYGASTTISANATGGTTPYTYNWSPTGSGASFTATPTSNTTYSVTVSDANTCTATGNVSVTVIGSSPLAANAGAARSICNGASTTLGGSPTASGGAGGFTYAWSGGAGTTANPVVSPTATTTYTVTVTSSTCTATSSVVVTVNPKPSVAPSASSTTVCYGASTTISANATGGTTPYTYNWSPTGSGASFTTTPTTTTPYNVTVTDNNTCTASGTVTVNVTGSSPLTASAGNARAICNGASTVLGGSPTASGGAGGYTYAWDNGAGTTANPVVSPTATTTYTVTVTSSACTVTSSVVVTVNPKPSVAPSATATTICNGASTTVSANGTGGTGTLTYSWSPSGTGASFTASPTGTTTYNVTVSDANTCTASGNITVNVTGSSPLTANAGTNRTICSGTSTSLGSSPTGNGGNTSGTYTYSWTSSPAGFTSTSANPTVSPTATTTYTVTVTNTSCTATSSVVVTVNPKPTVAPTASVNPVCSGSNTTISANAGGGVSPYTYQWNTSQTSGSFVASPTATGSPVTNAYTVTVTDLNLCTVSGTINVTVTPLPVVASISPQSLCIPATGGSATLTAAALTTGQTGAWSTVTSPTGAVTYSAPTAATTAVSTLSPVNSYIFKWTVTESGCSNSTNTTVSVNEMPVIEAGANDTICRGASKSLSASLTSISPAAINWKLNTIASTPIAFTTSHTVSPTVTSNYIFTAAINSCIAIDTARVAVIQAPVMVDDMTACQSAIEDVQATFAISSLTSNDDNSPVLKGGVSYAIVSVKHGVASISGSDILYTGNTNYNGQDTVTIEGYSTLCPSLRDTSIFCVTITPVNDTPVAMNDTATTTNGVAVTKNILMNDTDVDNILSGTNVTVLSGPSNGTVSTVDALGNITYTSNANYAGIDSIVYQVCDGGTPNLCDTAVAYFYSYPKMTDSKDTVLMNSSTPTTTGSPISGPGIKVTASSPNGTVTVNPDGTVNYTPDPNFTGIDTITRIVCDTIPNPDVCNTSYIIMVVAPKVKGDAPTTPMNTPVNAGDPVVLGPGATQTLTGPTNGTVTTNPDGTLKYTPNTNAVGLDTIMRKICVDGICDSALIVVQVTPVVKDTNTPTKDGTPVTISGPGLVPMAGSTIAYTPANTPSNGTATVNPTTGAVTYTPNPGFIGTDTIKVSTCVSYTGAATVCDTYLVIVKVDPKNITKPDINAGNLNTQIAGNLGTNDNVIAGTTYGSPVASASNPSSVLPTVNPDGTYTFTASVPGTYTFTISVCPPGQTTGCPTELLTITVIDPDKKDNKPIVNPDFPKTNPNTPISVNVLANDASGNKGINLDPKSVKVSTAPKNGTATVNPDGTISYTPNANFVGNDTFYYTVCDSATPPNCSDPVMVVVNVTTTPITNVQDDIASGSGTLTGNTLANDKFPAGTKPYVKPQDITIAGKGRFTIDSAGNYTWVPAPGFTGSVQIPIQTCDGKTPETCYPSTITFVSNNVAADATIPNYFSPNGDKTNDVWSLDDLLTRFPKTRATIYNRWGNIVWRSTGPYGKSTSGTNIWYGQQEGSQDQIPDGVYYYLLELEDEFKTTKTGFIEVMRQ